MKRTILATLLILSNVLVLAPAPASASHCAVSDALEPVLRPLGQCRNRAPTSASVGCDTPMLVGQWANCSVGGSDPDADPLQGEVDFGDGTGARTEMFESGSYASTGHAWSATGRYCVRARVQDGAGEWSPWSSCWWEDIVQSQDPPANPGPPSGPSQVARGQLNWWESRTTDPNGDRINYEFRWYKGGVLQYSHSLWENSGVTASAPKQFDHAWEVGTWCLKVAVRDDHHGYGPESSCKQVVVS